MTIHCGGTTFDQAMIGRLRDELKHLPLPKEEVCVVKDGIEGSIPTSAGCHLEQENESLEKFLEVVNIIESTSHLDILEEGHSKDGKDEHD